MVQVVPLAGALPHAGEHGETSVVGGDVVDELHDHHGLADTGTAEQPDLAALRVRGQQVDNLAGGRETGRSIDWAERCNQGTELSSKKTR